LADGSARASVQQDLWHYTFAKMVDACAAHGIKPFYGPFGAIDDPVACEQQFRNAFLMGCAGAWSLHPSQIAIAKRVFSPDPEEVRFALRILEAMPDGTGAAMIDGKMLSRAEKHLAKAAKRLGVRPLMEFFSTSADEASELLGEDVTYKKIFETPFSSVAHSQADALFPRNFQAKWQQLVQKAQMDYRKSQVKITNTIRLDRKPLSELNPNFS
jgi:hypothetical protein